MASKKKLATKSVTKPAKAKVRKTKAKKRGKELLHQQEDLARRLWDDDDLQSDLRSVAEGLKRVYDLVQDEGPVALLEDRKLQKQVRGTARDARSAAGALTTKPKRKKGGLGGLALLLIGGVAAVVLVPSLREKALDLIFGPEEEFDYASTTTPAAPAASSPATDPAGASGPSSPDTP